MVFAMHAFTSDCSGRTHWMLLLPLKHIMKFEGILIDPADINAVIDLHSEQECLKIEDFDHCLGFLCAHIAEYRGKVSFYCDRFLFEICY